MQETHLGHKTSMDTLGANNGDQNLPKFAQTRGQPGIDLPSVQWSLWFHVRKCMVKKADVFKQLQVKALIFHVVDYHWPISCLNNY